MIDETITIRQATLEDVGEIANVHLNSWREAYLGLLPQDFLDSLPLTFRRRSLMWNRTISNPDNRQRIFVAESNTIGVVGFVAAAQGRDDQFKEWGEIGAIYLLRSYKNQGIGYRLLNNAFGYLSSSGFQKAYCWVIENNPTCAFYERSGGKRMENKFKTEKIGGKLVTEVAYSWDLPL